MLKRVCDPLSPPRHIDRGEEEKLFLLANVVFGAPSVGNTERVKQSFAHNPSYVLHLKGVKGYLEKGRGVPFMELAFKWGYNRSNMGGLYRRYANWYYRNEAQNARPHPDSTSRASAESQR